LSVSGAFPIPLVQVDKCREHSALQAQWKEALFQKKRVGKLVASQPQFHSGRNRPTGSGLPNQEREGEAMNELMDMILTLAQDIKTVKAYLLNFHKSRLEQFSEEWIDGQVVMQTLHISKRTLQSLRDSGVLPYSRINGKFYYKVSDIEALLESNYSPSKSKHYGGK
jgi:hypothetical protein|tara:strand:- start:23917 stop:24417 length:501 start_codon:yes stop_codon:yes gene_type:complete